MLALLDFDVLTYRVGFASEHNTYKVYLRGTEEEFGPVCTCKSMTEVKSFVEDKYDTDYYWVKEVVPEPLAFCLHSMKKSIQSILDDVQATGFKGFLTGKDQFREKVATIKPYKGNRDPFHKPIHYDEIKRYLLDRWGAIVVDHYEADDAMAMEQYSKYIYYYHEDRDIPIEEYSDTIICSIDKDLDQVPGWHYNFVKKEKYWVTEDQALRFFYRQLLAGDPVDNIPGLPGYGARKAEKALAKCKDEKEMWEVILKLYTDYFNDKHIVMDTIMETAKLVYIVKEEGIEWSPPC